MCKLSTRCSILAATNPNRPHRNAVETDSTIDIGIAAPLLSRFDVVLILRDEHNEEWDARVAYHLLSNESLTGSQPSSLLWSIDKLQTHFMAIRDINPILSAEASEILGCYYKSCRAHPSRDPARTTVRLLDSLIRLATAHARLVFRNEVTVLDAVTVIRLMECSWGFGRILDAANIVSADLPLGPTDEQLFEVRRLFDLVGDCDDHVGVSAIRQATQQQNREILRQLDDNQSLSPMKMSQKTQKTYGNETVRMDWQATSQIQDTAEDDFDFDQFAFKTARMDRRVSQKVVSQQQSNANSAVPASTSAACAFSEDSQIQRQVVNKRSTIDRLSLTENVRLQGEACSSMSQPGESSTGRTSWSSQGQQHEITSERSIGRLSAEKNVRQPGSAITKTAVSSIERVSLAEKPHDNKVCSTTAQPAQLCSSSNNRRTIGRLSLWGQSASVVKSYVSPLPTKVEVSSFFKKKKLYFGLL